MVLYRYGTFTAGTTTQIQLNLGFIPDKFTLRDDTIATNGTFSGLVDVYWDSYIGSLTTPKTLLTTYAAGAPTFSSINSGTITTATGIVPYQTADGLLYVPNQAPYTTTTGNRAYIGASTNLVITGISNAANASVTATHSFTASDIGVTVVTFHGVVGMTQINTLSGIIQSVTSTTSFTVNINTTNFGTYIAGTAGLTGGFANVITGAPVSTVYSGTQILNTAEANLGSIGVIIGTSILGGATVATTDVWFYEAILQSPVTGP